jgi:hypothetical protein
VTMKLSDKIKNRIEKLIVIGNSNIMWTDIAKVKIEMLKEYLSEIIELENEITDLKNHIFFDPGNPKKLDNA